MTDDGYSDLISRQMGTISELSERITVAIAVMNAQLEEVRSLRSGIGSDLILLVRDAVKEEILQSQALTDARFQAFASEIKSTLTLHDRRLDINDKELSSMPARDEFDTLLSRVDIHEGRIGALEVAPAREALDKNRQGISTRSAAIWAIAIALIGAAASAIAIKVFKAG